MLQMSESCGFILSTSCLQIKPAPSQYNKGEKMNNKGEKMKVSNCCGARFYEPDYPHNDMCSACGEHSVPIEQDKPSIIVLEIPKGD